MNNFDDYLDSIEAKNFFERARREMFPKMKACAMSLTILNSEPDAKLCLEVGAALLFDKPLIIIALKKRPVPQRLRELAHAVIEVDEMGSEEAYAKIQAAIEEILRMGKEQFRSNPKAIPRTITK